MRHLLSNPPTPHPRGFKTVKAGLNTGVLPSQLSFQPLPRLELPPCKYESMKTACPSLLYSYRGHSNGRLKAPCSITSKTSTRFCRLRLRGGPRVEDAGHQVQYWQIITFRRDSSSANPAGCGPLHYIPSVSGKPETAVVLATHSRSPAGAYTATSTS